MPMGNSIDFRRGDNFFIPETEIYIHNVAVLSGLSTTRVSPTVRGMDIALGGISA